MAGPSCIVVATGPAAATEAEQFVHHVAGQNAPDDILPISDTKTLGGTYQGESRPFVIGIETLAADEAEYKQLERLLGGSITCTVELGAMCNSDIDYVVLGELAIALAAKLQGLILLGHDVIARPKSGRVATISTADGYTYCAADSVAVRDLLARGVSVFVK